MDVNNMDNFLNFRKLRGVKLYRSARPNDLTADDVAHLKSLGIKHIIDLRKQKDVSAVDGPVADAFTKCHVTCKNGELKLALENGDPIGIESIRDGNFHFRMDMDERKMFSYGVENHPSWYIRYKAKFYKYYDHWFNTNYYLTTCVNALFTNDLRQTLILLTEVFREQMLTVLKLLSTPDLGTTMVCCLIGRDRTGLVSAMVEHCMGWDQHSIGQDFEQTAVELKTPRLNELLLSQISLYHVDTAILHPSVFTASADDIHGLMAYLTQRYGSVDAFLDAIGFDESSREMLRVSLLDVQDTLK